jgi:hypothetical protein
VTFARCLIVLMTCLALPGCYVKSYGIQSAGGGTNSTITSSQVVATAKFSNGAALFTSGQPVSATAPGGQVSLGRNGSAILAVGLVFAEAVHYLGAFFSPGRQVAPQPGSIADTCSCYQKQVTHEE